MTSSSPTTNANASRGLRDVFARHVSLIVPVCIIGAVLVVITPLPPMLMDLLLAANITLSVVILLTTTQVANPLQFSVFPSLLLGTTLARLVLNIATTRLILTRAADHGTQAAGGVVSAFGDFVTSGSAAVGLILFLILIAVQFLVITKGATRISEVAARFSLDGMPGRQAAIDADLASGAITADQARSQRGQVAQQSDFYGAMDGASKFVRGDAIAGLVITGVNIVGGLAIGIVQHGMSIAEAAGVFTTLTIGDGLVSQLPALLVAVSAGLLVTRTSLDSNLSRDVVGQTFAFPIAMYAAAAMLGVLAFTGLPLVPMLCLSIGCGLVGYSLDGHEQANPPQPVYEPADLTSSESPVLTQAPVKESLFVPGETEPLTLELGIGLLSLAKQTGDESLMQRIGLLRQRLTHELGFVFPKVRVRDNLMLGFREMAIRLDGVTVASASVEDITNGANEILEQIEVALRSHSHELLSRQQVHQLLDHVRLTSPRLVDDVIPEPLKAGQIHQVLTALLREQVAIRNLESILGTLADAALHTQSISELTDAVRCGLSRSLCRPYCRPDGSLPAITIDPMFEASLAEGFPGSETERLLDELAQIEAAHTDTRHPPILVCREGLRTMLRDQLSHRRSNITVLSRSEVGPDIRLDVVAEVGHSLLTDVVGIAA